MFTLNLRTNDEINSLRMDLNEILVLTPSLSKPKLMNEISARFSYKAIDVLRGYFSSQNRTLEDVNKSDFESGVRELLARLNGYQILSLTLAVDPSDNFLTQLHDWVKLNVGDNIVLDLHKDASVLGGAKVEYKGRYLDRTLDKALSDYDVISKIVLGAFHD